LADTRGEVRTYTGDQPDAMAAQNVKDETRTHVDPEMRSDAITAIRDPNGIGRK
jgi:hypothetical protein